MDMQKYANALYSEGYELGGRICMLHKAAQAGDVEAQQILADAEAQAQGMMGAMAPAGAPAPEAAPMAPTIPCPSCGNEVTPNPDGTCPICQFDFNSLAAEAPTGPAPEEAVAERAEEIKQSSLKNPEYMNWLIQNYHHVAQQ